MIRDIFLPEKIGNNYLFTRRIIGLEIRRAEVRATKLVLHGTTVTLEACSSELLATEQGNGPLAERTTEAIKRIINRLKPFDEIHSALSSSHVVFRELRLPFTSRDKIAMVIQFEVEPLLPFPSSEAAIDFIITETTDEDNSATVLVAAVQKKHIAEHLALFANTGIKPSQLTVDLFALYGLYKQVPSLEKVQGDVVLLDLGILTTRIAYIHNGALRLVRTIQHGMSHVAKRMGKQIQKTPNSVMEELIRFGIDSPETAEHQQTLNAALAPLWQSVRMTLASFTARAEGGRISIAKLLLLGSGAQIKGLAEAIGHELGVVCEPFDDRQVAEAGVKVKQKKDCATPSDVISVATALPTPQTEQFNLLQDEFETSDANLLTKQLLAGGILLLSLFVILISNAVIQTRKLSKELQNSEQEASAVLLKRFPKLEEEEAGSLSELVEAAEDAIKQEEATWFKFSRSAHPSPLKYLLELTNIINKERLGFVMERLTITEDTVTMKARVRDHNALVLLERDLRQSKLFSTIESPDDPDFTMKLTIARSIRW